MTTDQRKRLDAIRSRRLEDCACTETGRCAGHQLTFSIRRLDIPFLLSLVDELEADRNHAKHYARSMSASQSKTASRFIGIRKERDEYARALSEISDVWADPKDDDIDLSEAIFDRTSVIQKAKKHLEGGE